MTKKTFIITALTAAILLAPVFCDASAFVFVAPRVARPVVLPKAKTAARPLAQAKLPAAEPSAPIKIIGSDGRESLGVLTTASRVYVADLASGTILYSQNSDMPTPIASITKLMTALVVLKNKPVWEKVITMEKPVDGGGAAYFFPGDQVTMAGLWRAMLVGSSNAAASALAASTGLSDTEFAAEMNAEAARLGLVNSRFVEPTGLNPGNVSTARDVARLLKAAAQNKEITAAMLSPGFNLEKVAGRTVRVVATDKLLVSFMNKKPYKILAAKTGYIDESGHNFAAEFSKEGKGTLIVVVIGSASEEARFQEAKSLAYWGFANFIWPDEINAANE